MISLFAAEFDEPKICISGKGLTFDLIIPSFNDSEKVTFLKPCWSEC